jgi:hypothetical protein
VKRSYRSMLILGLLPAQAAPRGALHAGGAFRSTDTAASGISSLPSSPQDLAAASPASGSPRRRPAHEHGVLPPRVAVGRHP